MKNALVLGLASLSLGSRETGRDVARLLHKTKTCDVEQLDPEIKWACSLDKEKRRKCHPVGCEPKIEKRCKCTKKGCSWHTVAAKCEPPKPQCSAVTAEWNCSKGLKKDSLCVKNCKEGLAVRRCRCQGSSCAWRHRGEEGDCETKVSLGALESLRQMGPKQRAELTQALKRELGLNQAVQKADTISKLPIHNKNPQEALLITSSGTTLSENLADIQENWVEFLIRLASFDKLTLITIDNGIMKE